MVSGGFTGTTVENDIRTIVLLARLGWGCGLMKFDARLRLVGEMLEMLEMDGMGGMDGMRCDAC